jgi:hypothetical protein
MSDTDQPSNTAQYRHHRAEERDGALSPGSTATGDPSSSEHLRLAEYGTVRPPKVARSPARPDALVNGQRVTSPHDMEPGPLAHGSTGGGDMMDRTEHPEQPAEGTDTPEFTEEPDGEETVADDLLAAAPGRLNQDLDDPSKSDQDLSPDAPVGSA